MEGRGGGEAQGVADPKMVSFLIFCRFGEFSPIGWLFTFGRVFLKITEVANIQGLPLRTVKVMP
jgi:hypothetical protein